MDHPAQTMQPAARRRLYEVFYGLRAGEVMNSDVAGMAFLPPHQPVEELLELFLETDHAWVRQAPDSGLKIESIILRRDILRALEPTQDSYSRFSTVRFRSLAHGSADCICCLYEGRVLHAVTPDATCLQVLRTMDNKGALYLPVLAEGELVGEIGSVDLLRAAHRTHATHGSGAR